MYLKNKEYSTGTLWKSNLLFNFISYMATTYTIYILVYVSKCFLLIYLSSLIILMKSIILGIPDHEPVPGRNLAGVDTVPRGIPVQCRLPASHTWSRILMPVWNFCRQGLSKDFHFIFVSHLLSYMYSFNRLNQ